MTDAALTNAHSRRGALAAHINAQQQRLEELRRELQVVDEFIARWHTFAGLDENDPIIPAHSPVDKSSDSEKRARPVNPSREVVGDAVESMLRLWGRPATRARLFSGLPDYGITIEGSDPAMVFSTMLWRMKDRFVRRPGTGYWFKDEPLPGESGDLNGEEDGG